MNTPSIDISAIRADYTRKYHPYFLESELPTTDPIELFKIWFDEIASQSDLSFEEINAVSISTMSKDHRPSSRMVLLKSFSKEGFSFYTNYTSRKGQELDQNNNAAMLFYWPKAHRQVRVEGEIVKLPNISAEKYWNSRPLASRIGSKASDQSTVIADRQVLLDKKAELERLAQREGPDAITKPDSWGGLNLVPRYMEFWQGQNDRLHDRIVFERDEEVWTLKRLSP